MANIIKINPSTLEYQVYEPQDENLILTTQINTNFEGDNHIEFFIYDLNQNLLFSDLNYSNYRIENGGVNEINSIILDPENNIIEEGFEEGEYIAYYNFLQSRIGDQFSDKLFISEISSDRTEIRLDSNELTPADISLETNSFIEFRNDSEYFVDFYLNFGDNNLIIANNIKLDNENTSNPTILVKLYES